jgi:RNA polymerase sigma factor (sigma-70 family)
MVSGHCTDAERHLVERLRAKDPAAFADLYDQYAGLLFRIGYSLLGDTSEAEDLVHDVFLGLPRALTTFEGRGSFEGWLKRVATRTGLMKLRQARSRTTRIRRRIWSLPAIERPPDVDTALDLADCSRGTDAFPSYRTPAWSLCGRRAADTGGAPGCPAPAGMRTLPGASHGNPQAEP